MSSMACLERSIYVCLHLPRLEFLKGRPGRFHTFSNPAQCLAQMSTWKCLWDEFERVFLIQLQDLDSFCSNLHA